MERQSIFAGRWRILYRPSLGEVGQARPSGSTLGNSPSLARSPSFQPGWLSYQDARQTGALRLTLTRCDKMMILLFTDADRISEFAQDVFPLIDVRLIPSFSCSTWAAGYFGSLTSHQIHPLGL